MAKVEPPPVPELEGEPLTDAAVASAPRVVVPELVANTLGEYVKGWFIRVKGGESGILPVVGGLLVISILFQSLNSHFLTAGNLVNLLVQGAAYMLLAMAEVFVLLLGEIDLSAGFVSGI